MSRSAGTMDPESLVKQLNECLPASSSARGAAVRPIFIVGLPRSGSTLLVQLLVSHLYLGYATNLVARFWNRPAFGVALNRSLSKDPGAVQENDSRYGRTLGYEGHHEFGWFWARWFNYGDSHRIEPERWHTIDTQALRAELSAMEHAWGRPLIFKNASALSMQVGFFEHFLDDPLYIYLRRPEPDVAASLWRMRLDSPGGAGSWVSTRPPDVRQLERLRPEEQVAGQVRSIRCETEGQLSQVSPERIWEMEYESLVRNPEKTLRNLGDWLCDHRLELKWRTSLSGVESSITSLREGAMQQREYFRRMLERRA